MAPKDPVQFAHALQVSLHALDALEEAMTAYHPITKSDAYENQLKEAEPKIASFLKDRLPRFAKVLEK